MDDSRIFWLNHHTSPNWIESRLSLIGSIWIYGTFCWNYFYHTKSTKCRWIYHAEQYLRVIRGCPFETYLVGGFNPFEKIFVKMGNLPQVGIFILKPPPRYWPWFLMGSSRREMQKTAAAGFDRNPMSNQPYRHFMFANQNNQPINQPVDEVKSVV